MSPQATPPNSGLVELHAHMAGWTHADTLLERLSRRAVDWSPYVNAYERAYGRVPQIRAILSAYRRGEDDARERFHRLYTFGPTDGPGFERFQAHFDLLTWSSALGPDDRALSKLAANELSEDLATIAEDCRRHHIAYCELRVMLGQRRPIALRQAVFEHLLAECLRHHGVTMRIAMSCNRGQAQRDQDLIQTLALGPFGEAFTAIDFCHREQGHPPIRETAFADWLHTFNTAHPQRALALLVHIGESYDDKSLESAVRWCEQASALGAHRLGHCLALGLDPTLTGHRFQRRELTAERLDQIEWDLKHAAGLRAHHVMIDTDSLIMERAELRSVDPRQVITHRYTAERCEQLRRRQDYVLSLLRERGTVIESCPSANLRIAGITTQQHPLPRFINAGLPVVVGSDDPSLLDVTLDGELDLAAGMTTGHRTKSDLIQSAWDARSELLSGRISER